jgi:hypothetical protein
MLQTQPVKENTLNFQNFEKVEKIGEGTFGYLIIFPLNLIKYYRQVYRGVYVNPET